MLFMWCNTDMLDVKPQASVHKKLQWQNPDGSTHYSYNEGKFTCTRTKQEKKNMTRALQEQDEMIREAELSKGE